MFAVVVATVLIAGLLAAGMCALCYLSERPPTYRITVYHYHDNRSVTVHTQPGRPALPPRRTYELEARTCVHDN